jgi:multiple sugar transport system substrate-binding protein
VRRTAEDRADYDQMKVDGKIYGFPDDGDVFILYYRKDLFEDPKNREEFNW